jgi:dienelactone hydrolase
MPFGGTLALLLLLAGCQVAPRPDAPVKPVCEPFAGSEYCADAPLDIKITTPKTNGATQSLRQEELSFVGAGGKRVSATLTLPASEKPVPCVILVHGLGGSRTDMALLSLPLVGKGWATLTIDLPGHGERVRPGDKPLPDLSLSELHQLSARAVIDLRRATDVLSSRKEIDPKRLGLVGVSLGAILGADFVTVEPRVKSAALWSGGAGWAELLTKSEHPFAKKWRTRESKEKIQAAMNDLEPLALLPKATGKKWLFLWGDTDTIVPTACCQALFDAAPSPKEKLVFPGGHVPDPFGMAAKTVVFLEKTL